MANTSHGQFPSEPEALPGKVISQGVNSLHSGSPRCSPVDRSRKVTRSEIEEEKASAIEVGDLVFVAAWGRRFVYEVEKIPQPNPKKGYVQLVLATAQKTKQRRKSIEDKGDGPSSDSDDEALAQAPLGSLTLIEKAPRRGAAAVSPLSKEPTKIYKNVGVEPCPHVGRRVQRRISFEGQGETIYSGTVVAYIPKTQGLWVLEYGESRGIVEEPALTELLLPM